MSLARKGKVPLPFPPHVAENVGESRALHELVKEQGRDGAPGSSRARRRSGASSPTSHARRAPTPAGLEVKP